LNTLLHALNRSRLPVKNLKTIIPVAGLILGIGGGLILLDTNQEGTPRQGQMVGALGPVDHSSQTVETNSSFPEGWISLGGGQDDEAGIEILEKTPDFQALALKLPGFFRKVVVIDGKPCSRIDVPGLLKIQEAGMPEVPFLTTTLVVPEGGTSRLKIARIVERELKMDMVEPSNGHLSRQVNPANVVPDFSDFYRRGGQWPKLTAELSAPFNIRGYTGVNVRVQPLRWDADKGVLMAVEYVEVHVITEGGFDKLPDIAAIDAGAPAGFARVHENLFANYTAPQLTDKYTRLPVQGRMLIVSDSRFLDAMAPFVQWKMQLGINVTLASVDELGGTDAGIAAGIKTMYEEPESLTWVILVGDKEQVPTRTGLFDGSDSDSRYGMTAGSDVYPDLFVSRISATNVTEVQTQINRFIAYEKEPQTGDEAAWYARGAGIASDEGTVPDYKRADDLRLDLLQYGFSPVEQIYQGLGGTSSLIRETVEKGCSVINYLGHGSGYGWTSVYFSDSDVRMLNNSHHWPWIIDVSCSNGDFALGTCFAETWLRAGTPEAPTGAIAMIAASSDAPWIPPTVMQAEAIDLLVADTAHSIGSLYYSGLMKVLDTYGGLSVGQQVMEQNVIFGDCSLVVRTAAPGTFSAGTLAELDPASGSWSADLTGPEGALVTLTSPGVLHGVGVLNDSGRATVSFTSPIQDRSTVTLTVSGFNMVPYLAEVAVVSSGGGEVSPEPDPLPNPVLPTTVALRGNFPNPFNPTTRIAFDLPRDMQVKLNVYDVRGNLVRTLLNETALAGRNEVPWDGRDASGRTAASGVYLYQLVTPEGNHSGRMLLTK
jgi:gingipain R